MNYLSFYIEIDPALHEIEIAQLNLLGIESFIEHEQALEAFLEDDKRSGLQQTIARYLSGKGYSFQVKFHEAKDWNAEWERNFNPIAISDLLLVRAAFHLPDSRFAKELIISPKMAFGTGHHETSAMILEWMLMKDLTGKSVLDFGCGTGILGIYTAKYYGTHPDFIDNDLLAVENTMENIARNGLSGLQVIEGSFDQIPSVSYDLILANITRNVLAEGMQVLSRHLRPGGILAMSGFLVNDLEFMSRRIQECDLSIISQLQKNDWICLIAEKQ